MLKKVKNFIEQHHMIEAGEKILAGVSGGADSVCLLLVSGKAAGAAGLYSGGGACGTWDPRGGEPGGRCFLQKGLCRDLGIPCRRYSVRAAEYARERGTVPGGGGAGAPLRLFPTGLPGRRSREDGGGAPWRRQCGDDAVPSGKGNRDPGGWEASPRPYRWTGCR